MPHELISDRQARTVLAPKTRSPVVGHTPPLAKVAASTLKSVGVSWIEHIIK